MRVRGNAAPAVLTVEPYMPMEGYVEVRIRENINEVTENDPLTESTATLYEYDEYVFHLKERDGLQEEIESNLNDWLITGRTLEINERASVMQDAKEALALLGADAAEVTE